ncbi:zinc-dependent peptidase [Verrucomicrobiaceae bacterium 5K15]|uniref:Zinc-dependent peptidase n=1 Tax=Oceaniferula flava TaxID=2800421 RepID=A0AAE2SBL0_9BACT|nr:zinc-dependent peptidase [Oceaniferula flavus]MBK1853929.1 zinc-dependent peptidase [Oceaniferula flavus]MBM1135235.1 zinc-dependent peptidase [Oceaniferula flavus]
MNGITILLLAIGAVFLFFFVVGVVRKSRRAKLMSQRLSEADRRELIQDFPTFARLPNDLRDELEGLIHVFLDEKSFEACGGMEQVSDHMRRVIAAEACLLLVNRKHDFYRKLRSILLYPSAYKARNEHGDHDVRLGESWNSGSIVLAWDSVVAGGKNEEDGSNVTLHEFAHQLDQVDGAGDGVPELHGAGSYREWAQVFSRAFERFQKRLDKGKRTTLDPYGATNPAEFFAVATETFYEKPKQLQKAYPDLYQQLQQYYRVDPIEWL